MFRNMKVLLIAVLVLALAGSAYAFAAANTVPDTTAGSGDSVVSGYTVSNIVYDLNVTDPTKVDKITFTLSPTDAVIVYIDTGSGTWTTDECAVVTGAVTCTFSALDLVDVTALNVVASSTLDTAP
jgi:hypothetical protein